MTLGNMRGLGVCCAIDERPQSKLAQLRSARPLSNKWPACDARHIGTARYDGTVEDVSMARHSTLVCARTLLGGEPNEAIRRVSGRRVFVSTS
jgi:hypothetical protein